MKDQLCNAYIIPFKHSFELIRYKNLYEAWIVSSPLPRDFVVQLSKVMVARFCQLACVTNLSAFLFGDSLKK